MFPNEEIQYHIGWRDRLASGEYSIQFAEQPSCLKVYVVWPTETTPLTFSIPKEYESLCVNKYIHEAFEIFSLKAIAANKRKTDQHVRDALTNISQHINTCLESAFLLKGMLESTETIIGKLDHISSQLSLLSA